MNKRESVFALLALAAAAAAGQTPTAPKPAAPLPPVSEQVVVSVTNIEVVVTDSRGNRISGLTRADFEVIQDGVPQTISNFYAVSGGKVFLEDGKVLALESKDAQAELPREVKARYVLYIDNLNIQPINRNRMFRRLKEFVGQTIGPNAEAMVVTFNRSLKVRQKFTSEAGQVVNALEQIELETGGGTTIAGERRDALHQIDESRSADQALQLARQFSRSLRNDLEFTVDGIRNTLNGLAGVDGRKVFVYVSEGLPAIAGLELFDAVQQKYREGSSSTLESFEFDMNSKYASIVQAANAQGVTFWALDASGLTVDSSVSAENRSYSSVHPSDFQQRQNMQAPLQMMAEQTGGIAAVNTNDWKSNLDELSKDFSNFYSIGYRSTRSAVDKPHSVEVHVKRKGLRVRARKGFVEKTEETRIREAVLSGLDYPRDENPLNLSVRLDEPKLYDAKEDYYVLPVHLFFPIGKLGLVPAGERREKYEGTFCVFLIVRDAQGDKSDPQMKCEPISVPQKELTRAQSKDHPYELKLLVRPGAQRLSLAVRDGVSGATSYYQKNFFVSLLPKEEKKKAS